jgi:hypothetical protein
MIWEDPLESIWTIILLLIVSSLIPNVIFEPSMKSKVPLVPINVPFFSIASGVPVAVAVSIPINHYMSK